MNSVFDRKDECCGCGACINICPVTAIKAEYDSEGFLYPSIDNERCVDCGMCREICAFKNGFTVFDRVDNNTCFAAKNLSDEIRLKSSSGGIFFEICKTFMPLAVVYGAVFDENFKVTHIRAESLEEVKRMMGSKYSQSETVEAFRLVKEDLKNGKTVIFSGTPCQTAGLIRFLKAEDIKNLFLVDVLCHGVPSPKVFADYKDFLEKSNGSSLENYFHRAKDLGWNHTEKAVFKNGKSDCTSVLSQGYKNIFYTHNALRKCCYNCKYTNLLRPSDITIADFWGIEMIKPEFYDNKGVSLVLVNTKKGQRLFKMMKNIKYITLPTFYAKTKNPNLSAPTQKPNKREKFWRDYYNHNTLFILKKYGKTGFIFKLKNIAKKIMTKAF